jgi:hypothetical protein
LTRKFPDLIRSLEKNNYSLGYLEFLATAKYELEEFDLDRQFFSFSQPPQMMREEEREAYEVCVEVNKVIFGPILQSKNPNVIGPYITYMLDQGLTAQIAQSYYSEVKGDINMNTQKHGDEI